jgi:hypothetical protein
MVRTVDLVFGQVGHLLVEIDARPVEQRRERVRPMP